MESGSFLAFFVLGAVFGGLLVASWFVDRRPLVDQFREILESPDETEQRVGKPL
jgi:hypothetical protein